jgi:hypothetical protein
MLSLRSCSWAKRSNGLWSAASSDSRAALYSQEIAGQSFSRPLSFCMEAQNEIKRTLKQQTSIEVIRGCWRSRSITADRR